ncbi:MAG TPA: hypothetical protein VLW84_01255 [Terriglobales bacterium]|nr:hypothetical protein [Terriglobales bacterium]
MKSYRSARVLLPEIDRVLFANQPSFHSSPLDEVIDLLCRGRHYSWMGVYLTAEGEGSPQPIGAGGEGDVAALKFSGTRKKIIVSMKVGRHEVGVLSAESSGEHAFGAEDRVLLEKAAARLARFLTGPGKYIVRRERAMAEGAAARKAVAASEK